jgi:hypothetical protein
MAGAESFAPMERVPSLARWRTGERASGALSANGGDAGADSQPDVPEYGPTAFFSILDAKTRIPAHSGVSNTRLVVHLPLVIPEGCRFRVGSTTRPWRPGEAFVFDDTVEHEAWNDSDVPRAILIFDIWNPYLSTAERDLVRTLGKSLKDYYRGQWPIEAQLWEIGECPTG